MCRGPVEWVEASGRGTVYSFTVIRQNYSRPFRDWIPYVVALVDLEEGPRVMTNIVDCEPDDVRIGMAVRGPIRGGVRRGRDRALRPCRLSRQHGPGGGAAEVRRGMPRRTRKGQAGGLPTGAVHGIVPEGPSGA